MTYIYFKRLLLFKTSFTFLWTSFTFLWTSFTFFGKKWASAHCSLVEIDFLTLRQDFCYFVHYFIHLMTNTQQINHAGRNIQQPVKGLKHWNKIWFYLWLSKKSRSYFLAGGKVRATWPSLFPENKTLKQNATFKIKNIFSPILEVRHTVLTFNFELIFSQVPGKWFWFFFCDKILKHFLVIFHFFPNLIIKPRMEIREQAMITLQGMAK